MNLRIECETEQTAVAVLQVDPLQVCTTTNVDECGLLSPFIDFVFADEDIRTIEALGRHFESRNCFPKISVCSHDTEYGFLLSHHMHQLEFEYVREFVPFGALWQTLLRLRNKKIDLCVQIRGVVAPPVHDNYIQFVNHFESHKRFNVGFGMKTSLHKYKLFNVLYSFRKIHCEAMAHTG